MLALPACTEHGPGVVLRVAAVGRSLRCRRGRRRIVDGDHEAARCRFRHAGAVRRCALFVRARAPRGGQCPRPTTSRRCSRSRSGERERPNRGTRRQSHESCCGSCQIRPSVGPCHSVSKRISTGQCAIRPKSVGNFLGSARRGIGRFRAGPAPSRSARLRSPPRQGRSRRARLRSGVLRRAAVRVRRRATLDRRAGLCHGVSRARVRARWPRRARSRPRPRRD